MKNPILEFTLIAIFLTGCSTSSKSYWGEIKNSNMSPSYCAETFKTQDEVKACELDWIALDRAKTECKKDSNPDYCLVMAKSGWDDFQLFASAGGKITKEMAQSYPVMCGFKEKNVKPCTQLKTPK